VAKYIVAATFSRLYFWMHTLKSGQPHTSLGNFDRWIDPCVVRYGEGSFVSANTGGRRMDITSARVTSFVIGPTGGYEKKNWKES